MDSSEFPLRAFPSICAMVVCACRFRRAVPNMLSENPIQEVVAMRPNRVVEEILDMETRVQISMTVYERARSKN